MAAKSIQRAQIDMFAAKVRKCRACHTKSQFSDSQAKPKFQKNLFRDLFWAFSNKTWVKCGPCAILGGCCARMAMQSRFQDSPGHECQAPGPPPPPFVPPRLRLYNTNLTQPQPPKKSRSPHPTLTAHKHQSSFIVRFLSHNRMSLSQGRSPM